MIKQHTKTLFKLLSFLLYYPGEDYFMQIREMETILADLTPDKFKKSIDEFITRIKTKSLIQTQEIYTAAFDMNPATTMNLTYHIWGDNEKRAGLLARVQQVYQDAGYERITGELPDYLPLMLEFLSVCQEEKDEALILECLQDLDQYITRLRPVAPMYADLLQPLADMAVNWSHSKKSSQQQETTGCS